LYLLACCTPGQLSALFPIVMPLEKLYKFTELNTFIFWLAWLFTCLLIHLPQWHFALLTYPVYGHYLISGHINVQVDDMLYEAQYVHVIQGLKCKCRLAEM